MVCFLSTIRIKPAYVNTALNSVALKLAKRFFLLFFIFNYTCSCVPLLCILLTMNKCGIQKYEYVIKYIHRYFCDTIPGHASKQEQVLMFYHLKTRRYVNTVHI